VATTACNLAAAEVNKVYPELVIRDGSGKIQGVRKDELAPMLPMTHAAHDKSISQIAGWIVNGLRSRACMSRGGAAPLKANSLTRHCTRRR
jgi:hypothetical protein